MQAASQIRREANSPQVKAHGNNMAVGLAPHRFRPRSEDCEVWADKPSLSILAGQVPWTSQASGQPP
jgi:hypothetical protein